MPTTIDNNEDNVRFARYSCCIIHFGSLVETIWCGISVFDLRNVLNKDGLRLENAECANIHIQMSRINYSLFAVTDSRDFRFGSKVSQSGHKMGQIWDFFGSAETKCTGI